MRAVALLAAVCTLALSACATQPTTTGAGPGSVPPASGPVARPPLDLDDARAVGLNLTDQGGRASVTSGAWTALVAVPASAAPAGATWKVVPIRTAPAVLPGALAPGVYVDENGAPALGACLVAFYTTGDPSPDATIFRLDDDGTAELVATDRQRYGSSTVLVAEVSGFSGYGVGTASAKDRAGVQARKKQNQKVSDGPYAISVHDTVRFSVDAWKFTAKLDLNLAGGGATTAGAYHGQGTLLFTGKWDKTVAVIKTLGTIKYQGSGKATATLWGDLAPLVPLDPIKGTYQMDDPAGYGNITVKGSGGIDLLGKGPNATVKSPGYKTKDGDFVLPYLIGLDGDKVTVEIAGIGEFSGNLVKY